MVNNYAVGVSFCCVKMEFYDIIKSNVINGENASKYRVFLTFILFTLYRRNAIIILTMIADILYGINYFIG